MFQVGIIASGSRGNSLVIRSDKGAILVDAGLAGKRIISGLELMGISPEELHGVVISHEHSDHISGAGIICRKLDIPLYISPDTYACSSARIGRLNQETIFFEHGKAFSIGDLHIIPFASSHDAVESSNFIVRQTNNSSARLGIATDCGYLTRLMKERLQDCTTLILESNHDEIKLLEGPYPWHLKQRVKSRQGHLSNRQAVSVISQVIHPGLKKLILAHLSEKNNTPELAESEMKRYLSMINHELELYIANQHTALSLLDI
ncbi:MAG: MBL fold metallo-hydrolase [Candidatus Stygibacter australis]|nr:MBL fold metallo-hydrolase [Candidatus Stygibacter australis]MDP8321537.1 MBL fold metallo-hydrolase [Candidatus Stygibacter australis]